MIGAAQQYAQALFDLSRENGADGEMLEAVCMVDSQMQENPDFIKTLDSPAIEKAQRVGVVDAVFAGRVPGYLVNVLKILAEKRWAFAFGDVRRAFEEYYNEAHAILPVTAVTAVALTEEQRLRLTQKLESITGQTVRLSQRVDKACMGGVVLEMKTSRIDGSVRGRLNSLRAKINESVL